MKLARSLGAAALLTLLYGGSVITYAQGNFGFGIIIGQPTGLAWKYKMSHLNAIDGAIGFSPYDRFRLHADYLWQANPFQEEHLSVHYGLGIAFGFGRTAYFPAHGGTSVTYGDDFGVGLRAVVGMTYAIPRSPVDLFFEAAPLIVAAPEAGLALDLAVGARVYP